VFRKDELTEFGIDDRQSAHQLRMKKVISRMMRNLLTLPVPGHYFLVGMGYGEGGVIAKVKN